MGCRKIEIEVIGTGENYEAMIQRITEAHAQIIIDANDKILQDSRKLIHLDDPYKKQWQFDEIREAIAAFDAKEQQKLYEWLNHLGCRMPR